MNVDHLARINWLEVYTNSQITSINSQISDITSQQLPNLGTTIANETARAQQIENNLQSAGQHRRYGIELVGRIGSRLFGQRQRC